MMDQVITQFANDACSPSLNVPEFHGVLDDFRRRITQYIKTLCNQYPSDQLVIWGALDGLLDALKNEWQSLSEIQNTIEYGIDPDEVRNMSNDQLYHLSEQASSLFYPHSPIRNLLLSGQFDCGTSYRQEMHPSPNYGDHLPSLNNSVADGPQQSEQPNRSQFTEIEGNQGSLLTQHSFQWQTPQHQAARSELRPKRPKARVSAASQSANRLSRGKNNVGVSAEAIACGGDAVALVSQSRLGSTNTEHSSILNDIYAFTASQAVFDQFRDAINFLRENEILRLPSRSAGLSLLVGFLERTSGADFAVSLCRRACLVRLRQFRQEVDRKVEEVASLSPGKVSTKALDLMVLASRGVGRNAPDQDLRVAIKNNLGKGNSWEMLCKSTSFGIICLVPCIASSCFERTPQAAIQATIDLLLHEKADELIPLARCLTTHVEEILEGRPCQLGTAIIDRTIGKWNEIIPYLAGRTSCDHRGNLHPA